jgi:hypothetical protein
MSKIPRRLVAMAPAWLMGENPIRVTTASLASLRRGAAERVSGRATQELQDFWRLGGGPSRRRVRRWTPT